MSKTKWIMKQYWRLSTIRALSGLVLGMLVIGQFYYEYIPPLATLGLVGALILSGILIVFFLFLGWAYDEKGRLWTQKTQATVERDPFRYVPYPGSFATEYPVHHTFLSTLKNVFKEIDVDTSQIDDLMFYLGEYYSLRPNKADIQAAPDMASEFMSRHPFSEEDEIKPKRIKISSRLKLGFEVNRLRLLWIQQLTGMFMDALVFGALYVTLLFPDVVVNDIVPLQYLLVGLLVLALPLFTLVTFIGWYYDKRMRVWSADAVVKAERNPYQYLPQPRSYTIELPFYFSFFETVREVFRELNIDTTDVDRIVQYLEDYGSLTIKKDADIARARGLRKSHGAVFESKEQEIE